MSPSAAAQNPRHLHPGRSTQNNSLQLAATFVSQRLMSFIVSLFKPLAYLSLPVLFLRSLAGTSPLARYYIRAVAYVGTLVSVASGCFVAAIGFTAVGKQHDVNHLVAKIFYAAVTRLFNITVEVEGEEHLNSRPAILMSNHQSMLDVIVIGRCVASSFLRPLALK